MGSGGWEANDSIWEAVDEGKENINKQIIMLGRRQIAS
jgi:hypothetical protein